MTPTATTPAATKPPADLVNSGCSVLTHDDRERIGFVHDAAVVVRDGTVESVTSAGAVRDLAAGERIDARGRSRCPA